MYRSLDVYVCILICGAIAGCNKATASSQSHASGSSQALVTPSASAADEARQVTAPAPQDPRDFGAMFQVEAQNRPTGTIKVEDALAAFRRDGLELDTVRQHLGRPYGARYCVGAMAGPGLALSICEYLDARAAQSGTDNSRKIVLANREIRINQATSLAVRQVDKNASTDAVANRLFASFAKL